MRTGCVFCGIAEGTVSCEIVDSDTSTVSFLEMNPATPGHTIVIPRRHSDDLRGVDDQELAATMLSARRIAVRAMDRLGADGANLLNCSGEVAWQTVPHFHVHVVPRYSNDPLELPWVPVQGDRADLALVADRMRQEAPAASAEAGRASPH